MAAYLIINVSVKDTTGFEAYRQAVPATIAQYGGRYLVRGGKLETWRAPGSRAASWSSSSRARRLQGAGMPPRSTSGSSPSASSTPRATWSSWREAKRLAASSPPSSVALRRARRL